MSRVEPTEAGSDRPRRRLDVASFALLLVGLVTTVLTCWLAAEHQVNALSIVPSVIAVIIGATHITKMQAPRGDR